MIPRELLADLHRLVDHLADNADTIGELAAALERLELDAERAYAGLRDRDELDARKASREVSELRDDLHLLARKVDSLTRTLDARTEAAA